jgi:hypothetical protein
VLSLNLKNLQYNTNFEIHISLANLKIQSLQKEKEDALLHESLHNMSNSHVSNLLHRISELELNLSDKEDSQIHLDARCKELKQSLDRSEAAGQDLQKLLSREQDRGLSDLAERNRILSLLESKDVMLREKESEVLEMKHKLVVLEENFKKKEMEAKVLLKELSGKEVHHHISYAIDTPTKISSANTPVKMREAYLSVGSSPNHNE